MTRFYVGIYTCSNSFRRYIQIQEATIVPGYETNEFELDGVVQFVWVWAMLIGLSSGSLIASM